ncbi:hypothetical protein GCM10010492_58940 [Saccharothrix mutabilis subsp. mutabilis]|uniref:HTH arsR-type domain-containing protein n=1 Tax=Saccharothrix mutabilis subsp. mutabilis TaxID=66855 RepID=A0ABN0UHL6_9PSEU
MGELAEAIGMEQSAVSHQLRLLRALGLVVGTRHGRSLIGWSSRARSAAVRAPVERSGSTNG